MGPSSPLRRGCFRLRGAGSGHCAGSLATSLGHRCGPPPTRHSGHHPRPGPPRPPVPSGSGSRPSVGAPCSHPSWRSAGRRPCPSPPPRFAVSETEEQGPEAAWGLRGRAVREVKRQWTALELFSGGAGPGQPAGGSRAGAGDRAARRVCKEKAGRLSGVQRPEEGPPPRTGVLGAPWRPSSTEANAPSRWPSSLGQAANGRLPVAPVEGEDRPPAPQNLLPPYHARDPAPPQGAWWPWWGRLEKWPLGPGQGFLTDCFPPGA